MAATTGIQVIGDYTTPATANLKIQALLNLIPNPDVRPAQAGQLQNPAGAGFLDEMSPAAAAQLRVELAALLVAVP